ncbi:heterokaryon incompatibility protein-domain-containing protein [Paraphoma chrysanthemicola]|nr:heterokaryon incompatibility protein-domain-containing protein [Paraphoma chrysanthemicola]
MICSFCDALGPMKPHHMLPDAELRAIFRENTYTFPTGMSASCTFESLLQSAKLGCKFCIIIKNGILAFAGKDEVARVSLHQHLEHRLSGGQNVYADLGRLYPLRVDFTTSCGREVQLTFYTSDSAVTKREPRFREAPHVAVDPSSLDCLLKARSWLDRCMREHGSLRCPSVGTTALPTRVISVGDEFTEPFLRESQPGEQGAWVALSYCWGKSQALTTTKASLSSRKLGIELSALPKTCRDAVLVARALSISYLWIDALCIVQDSAEDWQMEAARMCYVYEKAILTLAAPESGNSDTGLFLSNPNRGTFELSLEAGGYTGIVYARQTLSWPMFPVHIHRIVPTGGLIHSTDILQTRAWTMQELLLSPRILWFSSAEIGWSCWTATACECEPNPTSDRLQEQEASDTNQGLKISSTPAPSSTRSVDWPAIWYQLVQRFSKRALTVPTDRLPAISGLASALQSSLQSSIHGRYLAGIWEADLSAQLLWVSLWSVLESDMFSSLLEDDYAPSWTWASVSGVVRFQDSREMQRCTPTWRILSFKFRNLDLNHFGRGAGSVTMESYLLPIQWDGVQMICNTQPSKDAGVESIVFTHGDSIMWDPRPNTWDLSGLVNRRFRFLVGCLYQPRSKAPSQCRGLVLEAHPNGHMFTRLGYGEPHFDRSGLGSWEAWERNFTWTTIILV